MREIVEVARRMMRARAAAQAARREGREEDGERAMIEARALGWALGVDFELMEAPKYIPQLAEAAGMEMADQVALWRLEEDFFDPKERGERWWLLEVPPRDHADGTRTGLWSAFLSDAQYRELCAAVDAERSGVIERSAELARSGALDGVDGSGQ